MKLIGNLLLLPFNAIAFLLWVVFSAIVYLPVVLVVRILLVFGVKPQGGNVTYNFDWLRY